VTNRGSWIPNALTLLRIVLIFPFAAALYHGEYRIALLLFVIAALTDGVDGFLARNFQWHSRLGAIADPLADKALLITAYVMLTLNNVLPWWLLGLLVIRDAVIVVGGILFHFFIGRYDMDPTLLGKANTFVQILFVLALMLQLGEIATMNWLLPIGILVVAVMALVSGGHYVMLWSGRAWRATRSR